MSEQKKLSAATMRIVSRYNVADILHGLDAYQRQSLRELIDTEIRELIEALEYAVKDERISARRKIRLESVIAHARGDAA